MEINATLLGQLITFIVLVWFTMRYVWPPLMKAIHTRQARIAEGLAAAERGVHELELANHKAAEIMRDAKIQAAEIIEQANKRAGKLVDEAKNRAREEGDRLLKIAEADIVQEKMQALQEVRHQVGGLAVSIAEKILQQQLDTAANEKLMQTLIAEI